MHGLTPAPTHPTRLRARLQDPAFQAAAAARFQQLRSTVWTDAVVTQAVTANQAAIHDAAVRTFAKWPVDFLNPYAGPQPNAGGNS